MNDFQHENFTGNIENLVLETEDIYSNEELNNISGFCIAKHPQAFDFKRVFNC